MKKIAAVLIISGVGVALATQFYFTLDAARAMASEDHCIRNLRIIHLAMITYACDHYDEWPTNFQSIVGVEGCWEGGYSFVCPRTGHKPGTQLDVDHWTDYGLIPIPKGVQAKPDSVQLFCPPQNHDGKTGIIVFRDGQVELYSPENFWKVVKTGERGKIPHQPTGGG